MASFLNAFSLRLNHRIEPRLVTVGRYDGLHDALTVGTRSGRVVVHNPHARTPSGTAAAAANTQTASTPLASAVEGLGGPSRPLADELSFFNFNCEVTALAAGRLGKDKKEWLFVGSQSHLQAYNITENADCFYKDVPDGVNALVVGPAGSNHESLVFAGGNCSIQGFDAEGGDRFWTVTGDNVSALALCDVDGDGRSELLVGSDDFDIRTYRDDEVISETSEADKVVSLCRLTGGRYGFGTAGGNVGVYGASGIRLWRSRAQAVPVAMCGYDIDPDGVPEVVIGWSNGVVEVRSEQTGEIIFSDELPSPIAGVVRADYRRNGRREIIVCSVDGEIRGYVPASEKRRTLPPPPPGKPVAFGMQPMKADGDDRQIAELMRQKEDLVRELSALDALLTERSRVESSQPADALSESHAHGAIPADTRVAIAFEAIPGSDQQQQHAHLRMAVSTSNSALIRAVVVFADAFPGGSLSVHPPQGAASESLQVPMRFAREAPEELDIRVIVGTKSGRKCHVFELTERLPRFAMFAKQGGKGALPEVPVGVGGVGGASSGAGTGSSSGQAAEGRLQLVRGGSLGLNLGMGPGAPGGVGVANQAGAGALSLARVPDGQPLRKEPRSTVTFKIDERPAKVASFIARSFMGGSEFDVPDGGSLSVAFVALQTNEPVVFNMTAGSGELVLRTDDMDLAGDIAQSLSADLAINDIASIAEFPAEMDRLREVLAAVDEHNSFRQLLVTGVADAANLIRALLLRAEDARCLGRTETMKDAYAQLQRVNADLLAEHAKRLTNHTGLLESLRTVNRAIQRAGRLRAGKPQAQMVAACRAAIKQNNSGALLKIIRTGS